MNGLIGKIMRYMIMGFIGIAFIQVLWKIRPAFGLFAEVIFIITLTLEAADALELWSW